MTETTKPPTQSPAPGVAIIGEGPARPPKPTREEIALVEVGQTEISPHMRWAMVVAFLAIIVAVPIADVSQQLAGKAGDGRVVALDIVRDPPALSQFTFPVHSQEQRDHNPFHDYEAEVEKASLGRGVVQRTLQGALTGWLGSGNSKVVTGEGDWLFYRPGLDYVGGPGFLSEGQHLIVGRARRLADPRRAILQMQRDCAAAGVRLVLVPIPDKAMVHPERLGAGLDAAAVLDNPDYERFAQEMQAQGVAIHRPLATLRRLAADGQAFLRQDSHWTPQAMQAVAAEVAGLVAADLGGIGEAAPWSAEERTVARVGDLVDTLKLPADQRIFAPEQATIRRVLRDGRPVESDAAGTVLLLGDSFTNIYSAGAMGWGDAAGFGAQLAYELRRGVDVIAFNGSAASAVRADLARRPAPLAGKKVVVWQFALRELAVGEWKVIPIQARATPQAPTPIAAGGLTLVGTLVTAVPPEAIKVDVYPNAHVVLKLTVLRVESGSYAESAVLVRTPSIVGRQTRPVARLRPGQQVRVTLQPEPPADEATWQMVDETGELDLGAPLYTRTSHPRRDRRAAPEPSEHQRLAQQGISTTAAFPPSPCARVRHGLSRL